MDELSSVDITNILLMMIIAYFIALKVKEVLNL
jgi:hypothetical protein